MADSVDAQDSESAEKELTSPSPPWYDRTIVAVGAVAVGMILAGIGVFGFVSASTDSSVERDTLETLAELDDQLAQSQADTQAVRTEIAALEAETASTRDSVAASDADTSAILVAIEETEDPIRELQSEIWGLHGAVQREVDLENSISDSLDAAVAAGNRREITDMTSMATSLESEQLPDLESAVLEMDQAVRKVEALLLAVDTEFEVTEDFEIPVQGWETDGSGATGATGGGYLITADDNGYVFWSISPYQLANAAIEVTAVPVAGADDGLFAYGLFCRASSEDEALRGYWFEISGEGGYQVGWFQPSGEFVYLLGQDQSVEAVGLSGAVNRGLAENQIAVVCDGSQFSLAVNGSLVWEGSDDTLTAGNVALGAVTYSDVPVTVRFDDLRLTSVANREGGGG